MWNYWYSQRRGIVLFVLTILILILILLVLLGNQWLLKAITPGTSAIEVWEVGEPVNSVAFSPDGQLVAVGSAKGNIWIRSEEDGSVIKVFTEHDSKINVLKFSPDGHLLASVSADGVRLWQVNGDGPSRLIGQIEAEYWLRDDALQEIAFSREGDILAVPNLDGAVQMWNIDRNSATLIPETIPAQGPEVSALAFDYDGQSVTVGYVDSTVRNWRLPDGQLLFTREQYRDQYNTVKSIAFDPSGQTIAIARKMISEISVWQVTSGVHLSTFTDHRTDIYSSAFSPDGQLIASGSGRSLISEEVQDNTIYVWHVSDAAVLSKLTGHTDSVNSLAWSPEGTILVSGSEDGTVRLWQIVK